MTTTLLRSVSTGCRSSPSRAENFCTVVKTIPPDARPSRISRSSSRLSACTGASRSSDLARENCSNSWPSRSWRSVTTTSVGFRIPGCWSSLPAYIAIEMLLPEPCVCQNTPALPTPAGASFAHVARSSRTAPPAPPDTASGRSDRSVASTAARTPWNWWYPAIFLTTGSEPSKSTKCRR